ncbi:MAG: ECF transporter S component [Mycoplasma sp.]
MFKRMNTLDIAVYSILAAVYFVATAFLKFAPSGTFYWDFTDAILILTIFLYPRRNYLLCVISAFIGYGMADLYAGEPIYIPATFFTRFITITLFFIFFEKIIEKPYFKKHNQIVPLYAFVVVLITQIIMVLTYFIWDLICFNMSLAIEDLIINIVQLVTVAIIISVVFILKASLFKSIANCNENTIFTIDLTSDDSEIKNKTYKN